jgi:hypothetical protein
MRDVRAAGVVGIRQVDVRAEWRETVYGDKDPGNAGKKLPDGSLGSCNRSDFGRTTWSI